MEDYLLLSRHFTGSAVKPIGKFSDIFKEALFSNTTPKTKKSSVKEYVKI